MLNVEHSNKKVIIAIKLSKFFLLLFTGSFLSVFAVLSFLYSANVIYLIGDDSQLLPLFEGIISGAIIYTIIGAVLIKRKKYAGFLLATVLTIVSFAIIVVQNMVINNFLLFIVSFLISSSIVPVMQFIGILSRYRKYSLIVLLACSVILYLILFLILANSYESSGQSYLPLYLSYPAYISLVLLVVLYLSRIISSNSMNKKARRDEANSVIKSD
jgi:hypothetical protein